MKKGFTLIELLAVIIILAVIALIAVPRIRKVISNAKKSAAETSVIGYVDAVDKQQEYNFTDSNASNNILPAFYQVPLDSKYEVDYKGKAPTSGWIEMTSNGSSRYSIVMNGYVVTHDGVKTNVVKGNKPIQQAYPTYAYSNSAGVTRVGYPIDGGYDIGEKWVLSFMGFKGPFDTEEECMQASASFSGSECRYESFVTYDLKYKTTPDNSWKNYLRFKLSKNGTIERIDGCIKYKGDEHCVSPNIDEADYLNSKKRLNDIFDAENCRDESGQYFCNSSDMEFNVCPYGCVGTYYGTNACDITSAGIAYCADLSLINK